MSERDSSDVGEAECSDPGPLVQTVRTLDQDVRAVGADHSHEDGGEHTHRETGVLEGDRHG